MVLQILMEWIEAFHFTPEHLTAFALGLVISWTATQHIKKYLKLDGPEPVIIAFVLAFFPTYTIAPGHTWVEFWLAVACGVSSPLLYKILVVFASHRWEWVRNLSCDD